MKNFLFVLLILSALLSCSKDDSPDVPEGIDLRQEMRGLVINIATYSRSFDHDFMVIPQNGIELVSANGEADGPLSTAYAETINGNMV